MDPSIRKKRRMVSVAIFVLLVFWLLGSGIFFATTTRNNEVSNYEESLESVAINNANAVVLTFEKYVHFLTMSSDFLRDVSYDEAYLEQALSDIVDLEDFSLIAIVLPDGSSYVTSGQELVPAGYIFTEQMQSRDTFVTDVYYDEVVQSYAVSVNVPLIRDDGEMLAYIVGVLSTQILSENFNQVFYDMGGYYHVIDGRGQYVAMSDSDMMVDMERSFQEAAIDLEYIDGYNAEDLISSIQTKTAGFTRYTADGVERTAYFTPISVNGWMMYNVIPQTIMAQRINPIFISTILLLLNFVALFSILLLWVYRSQHNLKEFAEENEKNFRFLAEQTQKFIIEWNFTSNMIKITGDLQSFLGSKEHVELLSFNSLRDNIHQDDIGTVDKALMALQAGEQVSEYKLRVRLHNRSYVWCLLSGIPIANDKKQGVFHKAIGFIENIDEKEKEAALLKEMSQLDTLTKVYNKGTTQDLIESAIETSSESKNRHSLLIIDLDNFKAINDTFGHQFGDDVIKEMASYLMGIVRQSDIVGRIGGDEFFVFMKDISSDVLVTTKCKLICTYFDKVYEKEGKTVAISASIGVAEYPAQGTTYPQLYKNADIALYHVKKQGKNNYQVYNEDMAMEYVSQRTEIESGVVLEGQTTPAP